MKSLIFPYFHFFVYSNTNLPSITDWIQSVASILIVVGTTISIYKLFKKDDQRESQIRKIENLFEETKRQTDQFEQQTQIMREMLELNRQQQNLLLDTTKLGDPKFNEYFENELKIRKHDLMPRFSFKRSISIGQNSSIELIFINNGKAARFLDIQFFGPKLIHWETDKLKDTIVEQNDSLILNGQLMNFGNVISAIDFDFDLIFQDSIGTKYKQKVVRTDRGHNYKFSVPVEI